MGYSISLFLSVCILVEYNIFSDMAYLGGGQAGFFWGGWGGGGT